MSRGMRRRPSSSRMRNRLVDIETQRAMDMERYGVRGEPMESGGMVFIVHDGKTGKDVYFSTEVADAVEERTRRLMEADRGNNHPAVRTHAGQARKRAHGVRNSR